MFHTITTNNLVKRLFAASYLKHAWKDVRAIYGPKMAEQFQEMMPGDPDYMFDLAVFDCMNNGMSKKEATATVLKYGPKDWEKVMDLFKSIQESADKTLIRRSSIDLLRELKIRAR